MSVSAASSIPVQQYAGPSASAAGAQEIQPSDSVATDVYHEDVLLQLIKKYPEITSQDFAQYEQLLSIKGTTVWPYQVLPIMCIKAPLSIVKKYVELMEQMIKDDHNKEEQSYNLSNFLNTAVCFNPSEEVLRFLIGKGARLSSRLIDMLSLLNDSLSRDVMAIPCEAITHITNFYAKTQLMSAEVEQIRSDKTIPPVEQHIKIFQVIEEAEALFDRFQAGSSFYSPEVLRLIFEAASRPPAEER